MAAFEDDYKDLEPILRKCIAELKRLVKTQLGKIQDPQLVRIRLTEARIKSLRSLLSKAKKKKWKKKDILKDVKDILGLRIVCANTEDIRRVKELLLSNPRLIEIPQSEEDRTNNPTSSGYRDYKFYVVYKTGNPKHPVITCEIQIRTVLQDSWATLAHKDIYKEGDDLPDSFKKLSYRLSELLHVADQIAQDIRDEVSKKRTPTKHKGKIVSEDILALTYKKAFKKLPSDYMIRFVKNKCEELGIINIAPIEKVLLSTKARGSLHAAYRKATGWDIYDDLIFQVAPLIASCGIKIAADAVVKQGTQEWEDADRIYRSELESELPGTFQEFLEYMELRTKDDFCDSPERIYRLAEALCAIKSCSICGAPIIDAEMFSINAQDHYNEEDSEGQIESLLFDSAADIAQASLCPYHAYHADDD